jgi:ArsR family transcriptional regulator, arsenate/arsenite/antimonite-responsive transcriptional repressor
LRSGQLDQVLKAAADPTRLRLLNLLRMGGICVCDLQAVLRIPQPSVSRHLAALRHAGLVTDSRKGTRMIYALVPGASSPQLAALYDLLDRCCTQDEQMRADITRFRDAVAAGTCRLETTESEAALPDNAQLQGNPA